MEKRLYSPLRIKKILWQTLFELSQKDEVMSTPFVSVSQCLYMAYLMEVLPVPIKSSTQAVFEANMKASSIWDNRHQKALEAFSGLSPLDVRAQCALIRQIVTQCLNTPEKGAIWAYYGHLLTKANGIELLSKHAFKALRINQETALALTWHAFGSVNEKKEIPMRGIMKHYELSKTQAYRLQALISKIGWDLIRCASRKVCEKLEKKQLIA